LDQVTGAKAASNMDSAASFILETSRLRLREFGPDDEQLIFQLDQDPAVVQFVDGPATLDEVRSEILPYFLQLSREHPGFGFFAAFERSTGAYLGWFHFRPSSDSARDIELGYRLQRSAWGKGYATEASSALIHRGFRELGVERVVALALLANRASTRVMEKCGLTLDTSFKEPSGQLAVKYALDRATYLSLPQPHPPPR
jgi:RimJ/RimL family protein N-acetyltransferase